MAVVQQTSGYQTVVKMMWEIDEKLFKAKARVQEIEIAEREASKSEVLVVYHGEEKANEPKEQEKFDKRHKMESKFETEKLLDKNHEE